MKQNYLLAVAALCAAAVAPNAFAEAPTPDVKPCADVAWLVIGIQPATAAVEIDEPWVKKGVVWGFHYRMKSYHPDGGFIVVQVEPEKTYGVAASSLMFGKSIFGVRYKPCGQVPTFRAERGKVVYITTISYRPDGVTSDALGINMAEAASYSQDLEGARTFLKAHYPELGDSLEQGSYQMAPFARQCR